MKRVLGIAVTAILVSLAACQQNNDKEAQLAELKSQQTDIQAQIAALEAELKAEGKGGEPEKKTIPVTVAAIRQDTFRHYLEVQGKVDFTQNIMVSPKVGGVLTSVRVVPGDKVGKGQTLATIDATILDQNLAEVRTRLDLARISYEKQKNLWDQQIGTEMQYLTAKNNYEALQRNIGSMEQQRDQFNVKAPISGVVDEVVPNSGESVAPGVGIIRVVNTTGGKVVAEVSEAYLSKIKKGDAAVVSFPDLQTEVNATVDVVSQFINPTNRSFKIELRLKENKDITLRPNLVALVRIQDYVKQDAITVPVNLLQKDEKAQYIYVAKKEGERYVATRKEVTTGVTYSGQVEVLSGLSASDQIITAGYQNLNEGQPVVFNQVSSVAP
ncbi:efflux RND transporter periplasmic adaptor subunit [Pontibacter qinzhouensis]|uniref:Efflux RND transporter periplasmic adaptor subunit n=1 Tax=Pontibacter qinzhouensis TaxID=2603253 RepID=A0A5C8KBA9_9BACT|nr:efflux RND transporter periplasmic adaptor subunit [Pontibacter qinzhouensis]TXK47413.1 efflux RND transporter periplasmic adaptor subunit [Pontibacter qinzhouensis]